MTVPDFSDERPDKWWVLEADQHHIDHCGQCGTLLDLSKALPMLRDDPLCAVCAGDHVKDAPMTVEYMTWLSNGDPRWWSAWMCNCRHCYAEGAMQT
jgi:hypothetical protein